jgi:hypothetical protein
LGKSANTAKKSAKGIKCTIIGLFNKQTALQSAKASQINRESYPLNITYDDEMIVALFELLYRKN